MRRRVLKRFHPPGTSPGTLSVPATASGKCGISLITYGDAEVREQRAAAISDVPAAPAGGE